MSRTQSQGFAGPRLNHLAIVPYFKYPHDTERRRGKAERKGRKMLPKWAGAPCGSRHRNESLEDSNVSFTPMAHIKV